MFDKVVEGESGGGELGEPVLEGLVPVAVCHAVRPGLLDEAAGEVAAAAAEHRVVDKLLDHPLLERDAALGPLSAHHRPAAADS
ncbi:hypothetical protein ACFY15_35350 [Streptomyces sp. NPDC001373]|uniref:hypothetical protein n=1 Tax=Streptomyces sp. NPDC001373 TaxID=3364565 RepID=UPI0036CA0223